MNKVKYLILMLLIAANYGCSQQENNEKIIFKNTIEYSIETTSNKINPLIEKLNILLLEGKSDDELMENYNDCKSSVKFNKQLVNELVEVDNNFNLKKGTLIYLENYEKILDGFILPVIKYLNESLEVDRDKILEAVLLVESSAIETQNLSNSLDQFCTKYKVTRKMSDFEKDEFKQEIKELKARLKK